MTIGPKCVKCRKQRGRHSHTELLCPTGSKYGTPYHPTQTFQAKPSPVRTSKIPAKKKRGGSEGRKDRATRRAVKAEPCWCGQMPGDEYNPVDPAHLRSFKVSQCDAEFNLVSQCRRHHREQEAMGWLYMVTTYEKCKAVVSAKGWEFIVNESTWEWSMFNPAEVELNRKRRAL